MVLVLAHCEVFLELLFHLALVVELLRLEEALKHHGDGRVDIVGAHVLAQMYLCMGLRHPEHRLDVPHGNRDSTHLERLLTHVRVELAHLVLIDLVQLGHDVLARVHDVLPQLLLGQRLHALELAVATASDLEQVGLGLLLVE